MIRLSTIVGTLACFLFGATAVSASFSPNLTLVNPRGGQVGTEVKVRLHGERLDDPQELLFQQPGIQCLGFEFGKGEKAKPLYAKLKISPDAAIGEHLMRLRTRGGVSYLRSFWVGRYPTVTEVEPNNSFEEPQALVLSSTVQGVAKLEDVDYYAVTLTKGQRLSAEVEAMRLGRIFFDTYVAILDPKGFELAACDDATLLRTDAFVSIEAPEDGTYRIVVREAAYEGGDSSQYRLHIGDFFRPSTVFPPAAKAGETVDFRFSDQKGNTITNSVTIPDGASGLYPLFAEKDGRLPPSPNWIKVSPLASITEVEPNANGKQATPLPGIPAAAHGILESENDVDWFRFSATKGQNLEFRVLGRQLRSPIDAVVSVHEAGNKYLLGNDDQGGPDSLVAWKCPADGDYCFAVRDKLSRHGPGFTYRVEVDLKRPGISASLPVAERNNTQARKTICIPRGGTYAVPVNITRRNLGCDVRFDATALPEGVTMEVPPIPRSLNSFPVLFRAAADAPVDGNYYRFKIHATGDKAPDVSGSLVETINHIEINNLGVFHSSSSDMIAVAVVEEAPFRVIVEPPLVPIVPRGMIKLRTRVERSEGFDGKVTLRMLWKPPGIGAQDTISLEKGKTETLYEINATPEAPAGDWQICILGEAQTSKGPVMVSSDFVPLQVTDPWINASINLVATQQGIDVPVVCELEELKAFDGSARAQLVGLPHGTKTEPIDFKTGTESITFPVTVAKDAAVGKHSGLFLRISVPKGPSTMLHQCAQGGTLRIDKPRPAIAATKPKAPAEKTSVKPQKKPLSRLQQLRQQAEAK